MSKLKKKRFKKRLLNKARCNNLKDSSSKILCSNSNKVPQWLKLHHLFFPIRFQTKMHSETSSFTHAKSNVSLHTN